MVPLNNALAGGRNQTRIIFNRLRRVLLSISLLHYKDFDGLLACAPSNASDAEKVRMLSGDAGGDDKDPFRGFFNDTTIDPQTGALLGRYIAEERDSGRLLRSEYDRIRTDHSQANGANAQIAELAECVATLQAEVARLNKKMKKLA